MRRHLKTLTLAGAVLTASLAGLGASAGAAAAASTPVIETSDWVCNSSDACSPGPGDVGVTYAADLFPSGGANLDGPWTVSIASGSLPPGLQLSPGEGTGWLISGTPTAAWTPQPQNVTIKDSLGSSVTLPVKLIPEHKY